VESRFDGVSNALFVIGKAIRFLENFFSIFRNKYRAGKILALHVRLQVPVNLCARGIALSEPAQTAEADDDARNLLTDHKHFLSVRTSVDASSCCAKPTNASGDATSRLRDANLKSASNAIEVLRQRPANPSHEAIWSPRFAIPLCAISLSLPWLVLVMHCI